MASITCRSCGKSFSLDENKLPASAAVSFPCPSCKVPITVDRRTLGAAGASPTPAPPVPGPGPAPAPAAPAAPLPEPDELGDKALIVGVDDPMVRHAAQILGFQPVHLPAVEACRDFYLQEHPPLVLLNPAQVTRPPLAEMQPVLSVHPADRRQGFFILFADGLKTLDGTVAFLYGVNLVVAHKDLPSVQRIYREAEAAHRRLYQSFWEVEREVRGG